MNRALKSLGILSLLSVFFLTSTHSLVHASEQAASETGRGMAASQARLEQTLHRAEVVKIVDGWVAQNTFNRYADPERDKEEFLDRANEGAIRLVHENDRAIERMTETDAQAQLSSLEPHLGESLNDIVQDPTLSARDKLMVANMRVSTDNLRANLSQQIDQAGSVQAFLQSAQSSLKHNGAGGYHGLAEFFAFLALVVLVVAIVVVAGAIGLIWILGTWLGVVIGSQGVGFAIATVLVLGGLVLWSQPFHSARPQAAGA